MKLPMTEASLPTISYQVQYKSPCGDWIETGPSYGKYRDALDRLEHECENDPSFKRRIVQRRVVSTVMAEQEAV